MSNKILLVKPPFFSPWTPPLGIAILKSFLERHGYSVKCFDYNADAVLWGTHHKYFSALQQLENVSINDGYSKLWWILNAHMLAHVNGADYAACSKLLETIIPMYHIKFDHKVIDSLIPVVDTFFNRLRELTDEIDLSEYSLIGTSSYTTSLAASLFILGRVKEKDPRVKTVMGGGLFADDLALGSDNLITLLEEYPSIDHVIVGEGESLLLRLIQGEFADKRVISIVEGKKTLDMKEVPVPDFSDFDLGNYYHLTIEGARSCPFQCQFCSETVQWGEYRKKPADLFAEQVIELARRHSNNTYFMGDSLMNPYIAGFADELLKKEARVLYDGYMRADKPVSYRDKVRVWARSGLFRVRLGLESASPRILEKMDKMTTPDTISKALKSLANAGIRTTTYWIVGFPGETEEDFQETLDFIRANHRFIYELEAHPYEYYPYGQIGSRLYKCTSLYPDEITRIIKFKMWEIIDGKPTRKERFERLSRISNLSAELGLPNIYTMAGRYEAEERWQLLHPLTAEVYEGTKLRRPTARPSQQAISSFASRLEQLSNAGSATDHAALCSHVTVAKRLSETTLAQALEKLVEYNEILQVGLGNGNHVDAPQPDGPTLKVYDAQGQGEEQASDFREQVRVELARQVKPERGASVRLALINTGENSCELLLLAHPAIADGRGVVLLLEDLFRLYKQLSHGVEISLRPLPESYPEAAQDRRPLPRSGNGSRTAHEANGFRAVDVSLGADLKKSLFPTTVSESKSKPSEVFVAALLKTLAKTGRANSFDIDLAFDYRNAEPDLSYAAGAMTSIRQLPFRLNGNGLTSCVQQLRQFLTSAPGGISHAAEAGKQDHQGHKNRALVNLEYLVQEAWLGDEWTMRGFIIDHGEPRDGYCLEITPVQAGDDIKVNVSSRDCAGAGEFVEALRNNLAAEVESVLDYCDAYSTAKKYWVNLFSKDVPKLGMLSEEDVSAAAGDRRRSISWSVSKSDLDKIKPAYDAGEAAVILSAYGVALSGLGGGEDIAVLAFVNGKNGPRAVPVRLHLAWNATLHKWVEEVARDLSWAYEQSAGMLDLMAQKPPDTDPGAVPVFDAALIFNGPSGDGWDDLDKLLAGCEPVKESISLILGANRTQDDFNIQFAYRAGRFGERVAEELASHVRLIMEEIAENPATQLKDITFDKAVVSQQAAEKLAEDLFSF